MTDQTAHAAPALIELTRVSKVYASDGAPVRVLDDVSLSIHAGEFVAIVGASGSGKSTLMNILGCLDQASSGSYRFAGKDVTACTMDELALMRRELFGFVFQQYHLVSGLSAAENVAVPALYRGLGKTDRVARAAALLGQLGLAQRVHHRPNELSGGQQQRVSIARALMNGGRVLFADEPTGALDSTSGREVMALLHELSAAGQTIIVVTHDHVVAREAQRTIEISDGQIVSDTGRVVRADVVAADNELSDRVQGGMVNGVVEAMRAALRALRINAGRTMLTMLGIVVGVAAVVALLAVGEGTRGAVMSELEMFGTHRLYVSPMEDLDNGLNGGLVAEDAELVARVPGVRGAMPFQSGPVVARAGNVDVHTRVVGVTTAFPVILKWKLARGSFFVAEDERDHACVGVLGSKLATRLFPSHVNPVGKYVLVENVPFLILGVLESKGALSGSSDEDDQIVVPFSTGSKRIVGSPYLTWISVAMQDSEHSKQIVDEISSLLMRAHRIRDFTIFNMAAVVAAQRKTMNIMTGLLLATAVISLLVGGIGVMNVMLMSVNERTGEIGIRMAVGARRRDVLAQFLTEAVVLASAGGVLGLVLGYGAASLVAYFDRPIVFTVWASVLAFGSAIITGLLCGYLPARRAASLDPVTALARR